MPFISFAYETAQCNNFQSSLFVQLLHFKEGLFSAAEIARLSNNVHPCTLFDSEFWLKPKYRYCYNHRHPQALVNVEFACRKLAYCMPFISFAYETAREMSLGFKKGIIGHLPKTQGF